MNITIKRYFPHLILLAILITYIGFCFFTYKHYGTTADEENAYKSGKLLIEYLAKPTSPENISYQLSGQASMQTRQMPIISQYYRLYPALLTLLNPKGYYEIYHLLNMLFSLILIAGIYYTFLSIYKKPLISLIAIMFIFLTPRFFGDVPTNTKDVPFAIFYFLSLCAIYLFGEKKYNFVLQTLVIGLLFSFTQSLRFIGFSIYPIYICYQFYTKKPLKEIFANTIMVAITACFIMAATWPYVGSNFTSNLLSLTHESKAFSPWDNTMVFNGQYLTKDQRPQIYLFVWLFITTPFYILGLFVFSPLMKTVRTHKLYILLTLALVLNIILYLFLKPVIYNGIRHYLFLVPVVSAIALITFVEILLGSFSKRIKLLSIVFVCLGIVIQIVTMAKLHPYEYIYFNEVIGGTNKAMDKFELDYWGATYKEATEWVRNNKTTDLPTVYTCNLSQGAQYYSHGMLKVVDSVTKANYTLCDYDNDKLLETKGTIVHKISRFGVPLNIIRELPIENNE